MTKVASHLLHKLSPKLHKLKNKEEGGSTKSALLDFQSYLKNLKKTHLKKDYTDNNSYLVGCIYRDNSEIKAAEINAYVKAQFHVALKSFDNLIAHIEKQEDGLNSHTINKYADLIKDYIFDLKPFVEHLERTKNPEFELFTVWKPYNSSAFELFKTCQALYWYPNIDRRIIDRKAATNLSVFMLRQSMEIKFKRVFGIYKLYDRNKNSLRLEHEFLPNFIENNKDLIKLELPGINMTDVLNIYKWTNHTIHNAINPNIWEVYYTLEIVNYLFKGGQYRKEDERQVLSVYASVKLKDNQVLLDRLMEGIYQATKQTVF